MKESLVGFLSDVVRQVLGGGVGRDRCSEKSAFTYLPVQILLDVACPFPPYMDFCYNSTLLTIISYCCFQVHTSLFLVPMFV